MEFISSINDAVNSFVWGAPAIIMIMAVGLFLTFKLKGIQFRNLGFMIKKTYVEAFTKKEETESRGEGQITSFQAAMAAVSAVVGSGNTAGVATALVIGGPGALFWTLVAAAVGAATKYAEIFLGVKYREKDSKGNFVSGPMYYVAKATGWKWLAKIMGLLILFYSIIISAVVDTNTMALAVEEAVGIKPIISGIVFAILTAVVIMGGITRIGEVCGILAPFMAGGYLLCGILIIILNIGQLPAAISQIVVGAFNPQAVTGGAVGSMFIAMRYGMARGIFSNEAGSGSAAITHGAAKVSDPAEQAIWGPLEVFVDTGIVCTVSALAIVLSGLWNSGDDGIVLLMNAFSKMLPGTWGSWVVVIAAILFGYSCLITFYNYMEKAWIYLFGERGLGLAKLIWIGFIVLGSYSTLGIVWDIADTCNGLIIFPNLIALLILSKEVVAGKEAYYNKQLPLYKAEKAAKKAAKK